MTPKEVRRDIHILLTDVILVKKIWLDDIIFDIVQNPSEYLRRKNIDFDSLHIWSLQHPNMVRDLYNEIHRNYHFQQFNQTDTGYYLIVGIVQGYRQEDY